MVRLFFRFGFLCAFGLAVCTGSVHAQEDPLILLPSADGPSSSSSGFPFPGSGESSPQEGIFIKPLTPLTLEGLGVMEAHFPPTELWQGTPRALLKRIAEKVARPVSSRAVAEVLRFILLQPALPPQPESVDDADWLVWRLQTLFALGLLDGFISLSSVIPQETVHVALRRARLDALWLSGRHQEACASIQSNYSLSIGDRYVEKSRVFCRLLHGKQSRAELAFALLEEEGLYDSAFATLVLHAFGSQSPGVLQTSQLQPLHAAMMEWSSFPASAVSVESPSPSGLWGLARSRHFPSVVRIPAAEALAFLGVFSIAQLTSVYREVPEAAFSEFALLELEDARVVVPASLYRAFLYQRLLGEETTSRRQAEIVRLLLSSFREEGAEFFASHLLLPFVSSISPSPAYGWFADSASRVLLISGAHRSVPDWRRIGSTFPRRESGSIAVLSALSGAGGAEDLASGLSESFALPSPQGQEHPDASFPTSTSTMVFSPVLRSAQERLLLQGRLGFLLLGLGFQPHVDWSRVAVENSAPASGPDGFVQKALEQAFSQERIGETFLWSLVLLSTEASSSSLWLARTLQVLVHVGKRDLATNLSLEAALSSGI